MKYNDIKKWVLNSNIIPDPLKDKILKIKDLPIQICSVLEEIFVLEAKNNEINKDIKWKSVQILVEYIKSVEEKSNDINEVEKKLDDELENIFD